MFPLIGLILGIFVANFIFPSIESYTYSKYLAIAVLACMDSVFGGIAGFAEKKFDLGVFVSGFFGNSLLAVLLTYMGEKLSLDLHLVAVLVFGNRMFLNFAIIRRYLLNKFKKQDKIIEE
ncbi:MAG: small basic family protein [Clostridia bacterium]|nr:small basic family protein [Clostridia bacterium]